MEHRLAEIKDIPAIMDIISDAKAFLKESGVDQWQDGYPNAEVFTADIEAERCHVYIENGIVSGVMCLYFEPDPCYAVIENGKWLNENKPYATIHRNAVLGSMRGKGIAFKMFSDAEDIAREKGMASLRVDTHLDNKAMRGLMKKLDFTPCGMIKVRCQIGSDPNRQAYEKLF